MPLNAVLTDLLDGNFFDNNITNGTVLDDAITGDYGNDTLIGGIGNDLIDGNYGFDVMDGGAGIDTLDTVFYSGNYAINLTTGITIFAGETAINFENVNTGAGNDTVIGSAVNNVINTGAGNDSLTGGGGIDTLMGGDGNDIYGVDTITDVITELAGQGIDTVQSSTTFSLAALVNIENLTLTGTTAINGTGNNANNLLIGNSANNSLVGGLGNDILNGSGGIDTLVGGDGNDIYGVDTATDSIIEIAGQGVDTVQTSITLSLAALANIENLILIGTTAINGTGNIGNNTLIGNNANNILTGGDGNDILNGAGGIDTLIGGIGNDTYVVDTTTDIISEVAGQGTDTVQSMTTFSLAALSNIESLTLIGAAAINGTGNATNNTLVGNAANNALNGDAGNDVLNGAGGIDTLIGGLGSDIYYVDTTTDIITELAGQGVDTVYSFTTYTLGANIENLTLIGVAAINGVGNDANNSLVGNSANNTLSGGIGNDTIRGGAGNDVVNGGFGLDVMDGGVGVDTLDVTLVTGNYAVNLTTGITNFGGETAINFENVNTGDGNDTVTGSAANNVINTGAGNDVIFAGAGTDIMTGGAGNDIYRFTALSDSVVGTGRDVINGFSGIQDSIDFSTIDADLLTPGIQGFLFIGTNNFTGQAGELRYFTSGGNVILEFEIQGDNNAIADMQIQLNGTGSFGVKK